MIYQKHIAYLTVTFVDVFDVQQSISFLKCSKCGLNKVIFLSSRVKSILQDCTESINILAVYYCGQSYMRKAKEAPSTLDEIRATLSTQRVQISNRANHTMHLLASCSILLSTDEWRHLVMMHENYNALTDNALFCNVKQLKKIPGFRSL